MKILKIYFICILILGVARYVGAKDKVERAMNLDRDGKIHVKWKVDFEERVITFTVKAKTTGYVGLGISPTASMKGADIVIGGVTSNGKSYCDDYHSAKNGAPEKDANNDWKLISAKEANGETKLKYSRSLETCDEEDLAVTESTQYIIWAIGKTDKIEYHKSNRGAVTVNLLDPVPDTVDLSQYEVWNITYEFNVPTAETTYWCTLHRMAPEFNAKKSHIVAFDAIIETELDRKHAHHAVLHHCFPPPGVKSEDFFDNFVNQGEDCTLMPPVIPKLNCLTYIYAWSAGGRLGVLPDNVGYTMGETGKYEYLLLQMHYTNVEHVSGVTTNVGISIYYTDKKKEMDGAVIVMGADATHHLTIPPKSKEFVVAGHCASKCTKKMLPKDGVYMFNALLHTHQLGTKMKIRHFRGHKELPWIARDDTYDFNFQFMRPLREHVHFMPGDHFIVECTYASMDRENVTIGGFPTSKEMCVAIIWVYPYTDSVECKSYIEPFEPALKLFGIEKIEWNGFNDEDPKVLLPASFSNRTYSEVLNSAKWTKKLRKEFQKVTLRATHTQSCRIDSGPKTWFKMYQKVDFPKVAKEYATIVESTC